MTDSEIEVRGELLPLHEWRVELMPDGRAMVCVTAVNNRRSYYIVPITEARPPV